MLQQRRHSARKRQAAGVQSVDRPDFAFGVAVADGGAAEQGSVATRRRGPAHLYATALIAGAAVMVAGYFIAEAAILSLFDRAFGIAAAAAELPFNLLQGGVSVVLARLAIEGFKRSRVI